MLMDELDSKRKALELLKMAANLQLPATRHPFLQQGAADYSWTDLRCAVCGQVREAHEAM